MSDGGGGDTGGSAKGGGDTGGGKGSGGSSDSGKGGGGDGGGYNTEYGSAGSYDTGTPSYDTGTPSYDTGGGFDTGGTFDPTPYAPTDPFSGSGLPPEIFPGTDAGVGNFGPGPVGGETGLPGAGGGTNTPNAPAWSNIPGLSGGEFDYLPSGTSAGADTGPVAAGGVSSSDSSGFTGPTLDQLVGNQSSVVTGLPGGADAFTAPTGVSGNDDLSARGRDTNAGGTSQTQAAQAPGLLEQLGLGRSNAGGAVVAGAGLLNNLINGNQQSPNAAALEYLAGQAAQLQNEVRQRSQPYLDAAGRAVAEGETMRNEGRGVQDQGRRIIDTGESILPTALAVQQQGQQMTQQGQALTQYLQTGTLPEGYENQVQQGIRSAIARVTNNHVNRGMSGDPTRNSVLAEEIRQIEARAPEMRLQLAQSLANSGTSIVQSGNSLLNNNAFAASQGTTRQGNELLGNNLVTTGNATQQGGATTANGMLENGVRAAGLSADIYRALLTNENQRNQQRGQAVANFAAALNNTPRRAA